MSQYLTYLLLGLLYTRKCFKSSKGLNVKISRIFEKQNCHFHIIKKKTLVLFLHSKFKLIFYKLKPNHLICWKFINDMLWTSFFLQLPLKKIFPPVPNSQINAFVDGESFKNISKIIWNEKLIYKKHYHDLDLKYLSLVILYWRLALLLVKTSHREAVESRRFSYNQLINSLMDYWFDGIIER